MKHNTQELERKALQYAKDGLSGFVTSVKYLGAIGDTIYFMPHYEMPLEASSGCIHVITLKGGNFGFTFSDDEVNAVINAFL